SLNNLLYSGFVDLSSNSNVSTIQVRTVNKIDSLTFPIKINVGGDSYADYLPDQEWSNEVSYGYWMGDIKEIQNTIDISGTDEDELYRTLRRGLITYKFILPNGLYNLALHFSDNHNNNVGEGVFNIYAEDILIQKSLDLINISGKHTAYIVENEVEVNDGILDLYFEEFSDSAFINAIEVNRILTEVREDDLPSLKKEFNLNQNYPNPFNPNTTIRYSIADIGANEFVSVQLKVYDVLGNELAILVNDLQKVGNYSYNFDASNYTSGIYFYRLLTDGSNVSTKKMVLLK
ncbi:MAG: malectin domain-containing carbohydrate-binding protein, partial [Melioribacteraceae bacterium]|nr:malectin domain-containing carbohydrate-binding protein [Melioribacteraceae bacterium]